MEAINNILNTKRIACLYRVSTKGQVDNNDIPLQKIECRNFISKHPNWRLIKEYYEMGVSGYRLSLEQRDILQEVIEDAHAGLFDIILVFMFDRLGRKEDETPLIVEFLHKKGIEIWSCTEGQQKFDNEIDRMMNYVRFWKCSEESKSTSVRVEAKHNQMVKDGQFRGGKPPYGYNLVPSGHFNFKGKELMKLSIDDTESRIVKKMFDLVYFEGYGGNRITRWLNENNILSKTGNKWTAGVVNFILKNPIYKGYMTYGKTSKRGGTQINKPKDTWVLADKKIDELAIIDEGVWNRVKEIREQRTPDVYNEDGTFKTMRVTKSPLLFVGIIYCGHCGSPLTTTYNYKTWTTKDGITKQKLRSKYRCSGKSLSKKNCSGHTIYAQAKIETVVLDKIHSYIENLKSHDFTDFIKDFRQYNIDTYKTKMEILQKSIEKKYSDLDVLRREVPNSLTGISPFKPDVLAKLIDNLDNDIKSMNNDLITIHSKLKSHENKLHNLIELQNSLANWDSLLEASSTERKKVILSYLIDKIFVYIDRIDIELHDYIKNLLLADK